MTIISSSLRHAPVDPSIRQPYAEPLLLRSSALKAITGASDGHCYCADPSTPPPLPSPARWCFSTAACSSPRGPLSALLLTDRATSETRASQASQALQGTTSLCDREIPISRSPASSCYSQRARAKVGPIFSPPTRASRPAENQHHSQSAGRDHSRQKRKMDEQ